MNAKDRLIKKQAEEIKMLKEHIKLLEEKIARLERNSSNSSKPPSSDIINPKPSSNKKKRNRGGQFGHKKHSREPFTPEQVDKTIVHKLLDDEVKRRNLTPLNETESVFQQVDLPDKFYYAIDHRVQLYVGPDGNIVKAKLPGEIRKEGFFTYRI